MIELVKQLLYDPLAAKRWFRGALLFGSSLAGLLTVNGELTWQIVAGALPALLAGAIGVGEQNPKPPATQQQWPNQSS